MSHPNPASAAPAAAPKKRKASENYEAWFTGGRLLLLLLGLMVVTFPEVFFKGQVFFYKDAGIFNYPTHYYYRESILNGELPLWNPYNDCGIPFLAQWNVMVLYPLSLLYLLPAPWSISFFSLAHLLLAAAGMYALAQRWTGNRFAASVAGLVFAWNGLTLHAVNMWPNSCASYGWMPWVVLLMERAMKDGGRFLLYAGLVGAMQMLAGVPEIILYTWLIIFGLFALELFTVKKCKVLLRAVTAGLFVTGLTAAQMLPFIDLLQHSHRSTSYATDVWSLPAWGWANFFVPAFRTSPDFLGVFNQTEQLWTTTYYLGAFLFGLAFLAAWRARQPKVWFLIIVSVLGCLFALGQNGYVYEWVKKAVPFLGIMRYPSKWVQFPMFCLPLLAAFAIAWLRDSESAERPTRHQDLLKIGGVTLVIIAVILWVAKAYPHEDEIWSAVLKNGVLRGVFLIATLGFLANLFSQSPIFSKQTTALVVLLLIGLDLSFHQPKRPPTVEADSYGTVRGELKMTGVPKLGEGRVMMRSERKTTMRKAGYYEPKGDFFGKRATLFMNCNLYDHVPKVDGLSSLYVQPEAEVADQIYRQGRFSEPLADFLGVMEISDPNPDINHLFNWRPRRTFLPLMTMGQKPVFVEDERSLAGLFSPDFKPAEMVYLPKAAEGLVKTKSAVANAKVEPVAFTAQRVTCQTRSEEPAWLVLAQTYYHHWKAYVDGKETPIWRANHAFQAVEIPAGEHEVRFVYADKMFHLGAMIAGGTLALMTALWFYFGKQTSESHG